MNEITTRHSFRCDLNAGTLEVTLDAPLMHQDALGDVFSVSVWRSGSPVELDGVTVRGYLYLAATQQTVLLNGSASGSSASVTLDSSCYAVPGHASLVIQLQKGTVRHTVLKANFVIDRTCTDTVIDPSNVLPTLPELLAQIAAMEQGTAAANAAAEAANTAAANAQEFIVTVTTPAYILDGDMSGIKADKTYAEIQAAINAGKTPVVKLKTSGQAQTKILHLSMIAPVSIVFREHTQEPSTYNVAGSARCTFLSTGGIVWDAVAFRTVPDSGTEGQVLVKTGDSTYGWRDPEKTAPPIIPTATGEVVSVSDSANRPLAGLRLYGKTTQDGTPTPAAPVPLVNVGAGGSIGVKAMGKNLFAGRGTTAANSGVTLLGGCGSIITLYGTATATTGIPATEVKLPAGSYVLSLGDIGNVERFEPTIDGVAQTQMHSNGTYPFVLTKPSVIGLNAIIYSGSTFGTEASPTRVLAQLEVGTIATAYEQHKEPQAVTASTVGGLPGIPVSSGGNYTDENGQQWLCDEIDFGRGVYVRRIGKRIMDGTESWMLSTGGAGRFTTWVLSGLVKPVSSSAWQAPLACTAYKTVNADTLYSTSGAYHIAQNGDEVWISKTGYNSVADFIAYLAATPMTVLYALATPIETPLSAEELAAYRAMTSQYPNTTVYNDAGAGMAVDYIADTQRYIDGKLASISEALLNK